MDNVDEQYKQLKKKEKELRQQYTDEEYIERLEKALLAAEQIAANQETFPDRLETAMEHQFHEAINQIYRISHVARLPGCFDKHDNWEEEFQKVADFE